MRRLLLSLFISIVFFLSGCIKRVETENKGLSEAEIKDHLMKANKMVAHTESDAINEYISSNGLEMKTTGTGLRYSVYGKSKGSKPPKDAKVAITFRISLTDGTECYKVSGENPLVFVLGKGTQCNGMEEAIYLMDEGQKSKLIVPSHLGYGLSGDQNKIPPKAVLVIDLELIKVFKQP